MIFTKAKFDPTVIVGTNLKEFGNRNFRNGKGEYLVIEADEYHKSFLNHSPFAAMITNIDREHLDFYKNLGEIKKVFLKFISNIKPGGILVVNRDNKNLFSLKSNIEKIAKVNDLKVFWYGFNSPSLKNVKNKIEKVIKIPGDHNVSNCLGIYLVAKAIGIKDKDIFDTIGSYRGAWRRMEYRGKFMIHDSRSMVHVYDDYAHHPTEIKATLSGLAKKYPEHNLICVFQPHQAKRLACLFKEFTEAFDDADNLILLDIYKVAGRDEVSQNPNSLMLKTAIEKRISRPNYKGRLKRAIYILHPNNLKNEIIKTFNDSSFILHDSGIVVMMGAGDIVNYTSKLLK